VSLAEAPLVGPSLYGWIVRVNGLLCLERMRLERLIEEDAPPGAWYWRLRTEEIPEIRHPPYY
jgi:hypothetical protein